MFKVWRNKFDFLWLIGLSIIVLFVTFHFYLNKSYDVDEFFTVTVYQNLQIPKDLFSFWNLDNGNPPLFFVLAKVWMTIFGTAEWTSRLLPTALFALALFVFWHITRQLKLNQLTRKVALMVFIGINYLSPVIVYFRSFTLLLLLTLLTISSTFTYIKNGSKKNGLLFLIWVLLGLSTHYIYLVFFFLWIFSVIVTNLNKNNNLKFILNKYFFTSFFASLFLGLSLLFRQLFENQHSYEFVQKNFYWGGPDAWLFYFTKFENLTELSNNFGYLIWIGIFLFLLKGVKSMSNGKRTIIIFSILTYSLYIFTPLSQYLSHEKYWWFMSPMLVISFFTHLDKALARLEQKKIITQLLLLAVTLWSVNPSNLSFYKTVMREDWKTPISSIIDKNEIIATECMYEPIITYYLKQQTKSNPIFVLSKEWCDLPVVTDDIRKNINIIGRYNQDEVVANLKTKIINNQTYETVFLTKTAHK